MQSGDRNEDTFQTSVPFPFMGTPNYRPVTPTPSHGQQESQPPRAWQPWGQLLRVLGGATAPTEKPIVSILWSSIVGASSRGAAPRHSAAAQLVLASEVEEVRMCR